jgi:hypothetical protein
MVKSFDFNGKEAWLSKLASSSVPAVEISGI